MIWLKRLIDKLGEITAISGSLEGLFDSVIATVNESLSSLLTTIYPNGSISLDGTNGNAYYDVYIGVNSKFHLNGYVLSAGTNPVIQVIESPVPHDDPDFDLFPAGFGVAHDLAIDTNAPHPVGTVGVIDSGVVESPMEYIVIKVSDASIEFFYNSK